jgi:hypothetical protein
MALTYRNVKGSALTIDELDDNFSYFTGSQGITGSINISGSLIPEEANATLGTEAKPWKELYVSSNSIYFISGSTTASISMNASGGINTPVETASYADYAGHADTATTASYALNFNPSATASYAVNALSASYAPNIYNSDGTLIENRTVTLGGNDLIFDGSQGEKFHISSSELSEVLISNLKVETREYVVSYNPVDGALYAMPTSSIAGSGSGSAFPYTGSATISGSLTVDGTIINDFPQVNLYPTGSTIADALELQLGVVNIVHGSGSVKMPDPVYGRIVRVVNSNLSAPLGTTLNIYPSSTSGSFTLTNSTGSATQIPSNNLMYKFECIENPGPGVWSLIQSSTTYLEKTIYYPMYYDTGGSGNAATSFLGASNNLAGSVQTISYTQNGYVPWAATSPQLMTDLIPYNGYSGYPNWADWGADTAKFGSAMCKDFVTYTNITASAYPWSSGDTIQIENINAVNTTGSYSTNIKFGAAQTFVSLVHRSYLGYVGTPYYSTGSWASPWAELGAPPGDPLNNRVVGNSFGSAYYATSPNAVASTLGGTTLATQPILALPSDVASHMSYATNGVDPITAGTPVEVHYGVGAPNLNAWFVLHDDSSQLPTFTDTRIIDWEDGLVGLDATLNGGLTDGTYNSTTYPYLNQQYGIESISVAAGKVTAIKWTYDDSYAFWSGTYPYASPTFPAPAVGDSLTLILDPFTPSQTIVLGPLAASDFYQKTWRPSKGTGYQSYWWSPILSWNTTAAANTKAAYDAAGGKLRIEAVNKATWAFM